jgi:hypothetical protein
MADWQLRRARASLLSRLACSFTRGRGRLAGDSRSALGDIASSVPGPIRCIHGSRTHGRSRVRDFLSGAIGRIRCTLGSFPDTSRSFLRGLTHRFSPYVNRIADLGCSVTGTPTLDHSDTCNRTAGSGENQKGLLHRNSSIRKLELASAGEPSSFPPRVTVRFDL